MTHAMTSNRIAWIDYAKGICIILVVMMHTVHGYEDVVQMHGWLSPVVDFARPFRMPDFFLISGLFLSKTLHGPARSFLDRKIVHFAYFYLLWLTIQLPILELGLLASDPIGFAATWLHALWEPTNTLWFVHMLMVFYIATWLLRNVPKWIVLGGAIALQTAYQFDLIDTGWQVADRFCNRFIYFYLGYAAAPYIFKLASQLSARLWLVLALLPAWALLNAFAVSQDLHNAPVTSLLLGLAGAFAICAVSAMLARLQIGDGLRYAGKHSIVIYLTFFFPMKVMSKVFYTVGEPFGSVGLATAIVLVTAVVTPLIFHHLIKSTPLSFLYVRPDRFRLKPETGLQIPEPA